MIKMKKSQLFEYLILVLILSLGLISFISSAGDKRLQFKVGVITACLYIIWGVLHHNLEKTLYLKIVIEYIAVAILAMVILGGLLL